MPTHVEFKDVVRDLDWQRASFLKFCLTVTERNTPNKTPEEAVIRKILGGYFTLALMFYKQCRMDLAKHYDELKDLDALDVKLNLQKALHKLVEEWYRIYAVVTAIRASKSDEASRSLVDRMNPFIDVALRDVAFSRATFPVILQFGESYSLRFSNYSNNFAALSVPLWVMESPWEWTILWHELGGEKVRKLKSDEPGFFKSMYQSVMNELDPEAQAAAQDTGWSVEWFEELFEDSFSVIHFPIHFLIVFKNLLERCPDGGKWQRHPPHATRLATAMRLQLEIKKLADMPSDWKEHWSELHDEDFPNRFNQFDPQKQLPSETDQAIVKSVAQRIMEWHQSNHVDKNNDNQLQSVIGKAITRYARGEDHKEIFEETLDGLTNVNEVEETVQELNDPAYDALSVIIKKAENLLDELPTEVMTAHPQVQELLRELDYTKLLRVSFGKEDFHNINDVHFRQNNTNYWVDPTTWHNALFDSIGQPRGKFFIYDGEPQPLKLGFIKIEEIGLENGIEKIRQRWQAVLADWEAVQKSQI